MDSISYLGYLYWNPIREAFFLPILHYPVYWYGVLFVIAFLLGYLLLQPIFRNFFAGSSFLTLLDIVDHKKFLEILQTSPSPCLQAIHFFLVKKVGVKNLQQITTHQASQEQVVKELNVYLKQHDLSPDTLAFLCDHTIADTKKRAHILTDRLCWFVLIGTLVGARLGAVLLYDWSYFKEHPLAILKIQEGGLASHGGAIGVILALYCYTKYIRRYFPSLTFLHLVDFVAIPSALGGFFIRLGNFINQEIIGIPSNASWAILFAQPLDGSAAIPRHPVQLYEGFCYLLTFVILCSVWYYTQKQKKTQSGLIAGLFFILIFGSRFILEFWKEHQDSILPFHFLQMGQLLSIPFILLGIYLCVLYSRSNSQFEHPCKC